MKKLFAVVLAMALFLISFALADEAAPADIPLMLRLAISATAQMQANAITKQWNGAEQVTAMRLAAYNFGHPLAAAVIELKPEQVDALCGSLGCDPKEISEVLNTTINGQYSQSYTDIASQLSINNQRTTKAVHEINTTAALLVYKHDMVLVIAYPDKQESAFYLTSTQSIAENFDAAYVEQILASVGLHDVSFSVLTAQDIEARKRPEYLGTIDEKRALTHAVAASEQSIRLLLPTLLDCRLFEISSVGIQLTDTWLEAHDDSPEELLAAARFVKETMDPIISENKEYRRWLTMEGLRSDTALDAAMLPEMVFSDIAAEESPINSGDKIIAVHHDERRDLFWLQGYLMAGMPLQSIPEKIEDADWILLLSTHWEEAGKSMGVTYYTAVSEISLHNAKTGECTMYLGQQQDKLKGYNLATSKEFYVSVVWESILRKVQDTLFDE